MRTPKKAYAKRSGDHSLVPGDTAVCGYDHEPLRINLLLRLVGF
jgi:hypothetical protein